MKKALKQSLSFLLAITIILSSGYVGFGEIDFSSLFAVKVKAASIDDLTFRLNSDGISYSISACNARANGDLVIPDTYNGFPVTNIDSNAFPRTINLTSITIPENIINIGENAFYGCTSLKAIYITDLAKWCCIDFANISSNPLTYASNLYLNGELVTKLVIPDGVTSIKDYAFNACTSIISVTIPDSVTSIGKSAFSNSNLTGLTIPDSVTSIGSNAFRYCSKLESVIIGSGVNSIDGWTFEFCTNLTSIIIPDSVISIGNYAFYHCENLTSIKIPDSVTNIGEWAFSSCTSLTSITIPDSVTNIGEDAFSSCTSLTSISLGNGITSIDANTFEDCTNLTSMTIPYSVTRIRNCAFRGCTSLTSITIPDSITSIGEEAFGDCSSLAFVAIGNGVKSIDEYAFSNCTNITSITIPNNITCIKAWTFSNCISLTSITIPDSVTRIEAWAFSSCTNLNTVYYGGTEENWNEIDIEIIDNSFYNDYLLKANIIFSSSNEPGVVPPVLPEYEPTVINNGEFTCVDFIYSGESGFDYDDAYFDKPATEYNHELATMSLCLALSTFQSKDIIHEDGKKLTSQNVASLLEKCGFTNIIPYNYEVQTISDDVGCIIAQKNIGNETLIAVAVRSGGYDKEWASNVTLGITGDHQGFYEASAIVLDRIKSYINENGISGDVKFWLAGYSRGAATATQTAAKLNFTSINNVLFSKDDIYAYGFATPAGAIEDSDPTNLAKYGNIFNIINFHDIVPRVAPELWGFGRYGKTYYLPFSENSWGSTVEKEQEVIDWFEENSLDYKVDEFIPVYPDIAISPVPISNDTLGVFCEKLINDIALSITFRSIYTTNLQNTLRAIWTENPDITAPFAIKKVIEILGNEVLLKPQYVITAIGANSMLAEAHAKFGAYYLGWMEKIPADRALDYLNNGDIRHWLFNCPVDVYVYDQSGNLVAAVENDMPVEIESAPFSYGVDENGQKYFYLPVDAKYDVKVKAREACETTCTVNEFSGGSFTESRVVTFTEIPMEKGEELSVSTGSYTEDDIVNGTEEGSSAEYKVQSEDEKTIEPNVDVSGDEIENYTYNVTIEYDENKGIVYGGGDFTIGQFCQVTAENKPGYKFSKWTVNSETVSTESTYRFAVKEDVTIVAEYVLCEHPKYKAEVVAPTCTVDGYTKHTCEVCTHSYNDTIVKSNGHIPSNWIIDKQATVNASGSKHKECTTCGEKLETATISQLKPATPKVTSTNAIGGVQINWNKVSGAVKYNVYRRSAGQTSYTYLGTTTGNTFLDKNVKSGQYYCYTVRAFNCTGGYSAYVYANTSTRKYMATPKLTTIYNHQNGLAIKWNAVAGVTKGYRVYRRGAGQTTWTYLGTTKNLYFIDSQVKNRNGEYFRYTVIADGDYHSKFDTTGLYLRRLANPTLNSAVSLKTGITVKWGKVAGSSGYYVYRKTANSTWTCVATVKGVNNLNYLDKTAKKGVTYTYTVRAYYGGTRSAYYSGISCKDKY